MSSLYSRSAALERSGSLLSAPQMQGSRYTDRNYDKELLSAAVLGLAR